MNANKKISREGEKNAQFPFLDFLVQRHGDGRINTNVYRKSSTSDIVLHYSSNHPTNHKRLCVKTLFDRARLYCSGKTTLTLDRFYLLNMFRNYGYLLSFIRRSYDAKSPAKSRFKSGGTLLTTSSQKKRTVLLQETLLA